jgi:hypothetical protein
LHAGRRGWDATATYTLHRGFVRTDEGATNVGQSLLMTVGFSPGPADRLWATAAVLEGAFVVDPGETGLRTTDAVIYYSHWFALPARVRLATNASVTVPISYSSQRESNVTSPGVSVVAMRRLGDFAVRASVGGRFYWDRYTTAATQGDAASGNGSTTANTKWSLTTSLSAEYEVPFHRALRIGAGVLDDYRWAYDVESLPPSSSFPGATSGSGQQPMQQSYGVDFHAAYVLPALSGPAPLSGFESILIVGVDNGMAGSAWFETPTDVLHDGTVHTYFLFRDTAEVYVALSGAY